jgi:hypothetical protein
MTNGDLCRETRSQRSQRTWELHSQSNNLKPSDPEASLTSCHVITAGDSVRGRKQLLARRTLYMMHHHPRHDDFPLRPALVNAGWHSCSCNSRSSNYNIAGRNFLNSSILRRTRVGPGVDCTQVVTKDAGSSSLTLGLLAAEAGASRPLTPFFPRCRPDTNFTWSASPVSFSGSRP